MQDYFGIDLGTTYSAIAWGRAYGLGEIKPQLIEIENREDSRGEGIRRSLLPSCVYYRCGHPPEVGIWAKKQFWKEPLHVAKSMKPCMDDIRKKYPSEHASVTWTSFSTSKAILKHLKHAGDHFCQGDINSFPIKITIPVSFGDKRTQATLSAAKSAGIGINKDDLIPEPHAALYNFCNGLSSSEDHDYFTEAKTVLVFDLGGGTLDVSIHKVTEEDPGWAIENIADSGYIQFGGDDFDKEVAERLLNNYVCCPALPTSEVDSLKLRLQAIAQEAKQNFTGQIDEGIEESQMSFPITLPISLNDSSLGNFSHKLLWDEYKGFINDFLAQDLTLSSKKTNYVGKKNIISPILQVLDKADSTQVDAVLLNGGMTKLPIIRERLEDFFENPEIVRTEENPDAAVACGAVVYQHKNP